MPPPMSAAEAAPRASLPLMPPMITPPMTSDAAMTLMPLR